MKTIIPATTTDKEKKAATNKAKKEQLNKEKAALVKVQEETKKKTPAQIEKEKKELEKNIIAERKAAKEKAEKERKERLEAKKAGKVKAYRKQDACFDAIKIICKKGATFQEIYNKVAELYKDKTGQTISEKMNMIDYSLYILDAFGVITKTGKTYKLNKIEGIKLETVYKK